MTFTRGHNRAPEPQPELYRGAYALRLERAGDDSLAIEQIAIELSLFDKTGKPARLAAIEYSLRNDWEAYDQGLGLPPKLVPYPTLAVFWRRLEKASGSVLDAMARRVGAYRQPTHRSDEELREEMVDVGLHFGKLELRSNLGPANKLLLVKEDRQSNLPGWEAVFGE